MAPPPLLAVPNFSEGRDRAAIARLESAFAKRAELLDSHSDEVHNRTVLTLAAAASPVSDVLVAGASACVEAIDMGRHAGEHPCIGALDVAPVIFLTPDSRAPAKAAAMAAAEGIAELGVPVFLYGALAGAAERRERAHFRGGGLDTLARRMQAGELEPDLGPPAPHPTAGATLVTARAPLAAFNLELEGLDVEAAKAVAASLREAGGGLPGVRAIGLDLGAGRTQISTNVHDPVSLPLAEVVERAAALAAPRGRVSGAEVVGLVPRAALSGFPADLLIHSAGRDWDPAHGVIEERIAAAR